MFPLLSMMLAEDLAFFAVLVVIVVNGTPAKILQSLHCRVFLAALRRIKSLSHVALNRCEKVLKSLRADPLSIVQLYVYLYIRQTPS